MVALSLTHAAVRPCCNASPGIGRASLICENEVRLDDVGRILRTSAARCCLSSAAYWHNALPFIASLTLPAGILLATSFRRMLSKRISLSMDPVYKPT